MGLFSGNKSRSSTSTVTDIDETNISTSEADNRIAQQGSTQGGSAKVSGNVAGNLILQTSDASGEVIALASNVIEIGGRANDRAIDFAGSAVDAAGEFGLAALEQNSENLDTIV
ncbi:MAG: hypothetical protein JKY86_07575, partial [Gammaproteobacteria bacterium]|nr:hypothetical protein [Gammaproteobacteria bacterium]